MALKLIIRHDRYFMQMQLSGNNITTSDTCILCGQWGKLCMMEVQAVCKLLIFPAQFCCESKSVLKYSLFEKHKSPLYWWWTLSILVKTYFFANIFTQTFRTILLSKLELSPKPLSDNITSVHLKEKVIGEAETQ